MTSATTTTAIPPAHKIRRLYLKGASVEVPHMARMPRTAVQPVVGIDVQTVANEGWPGTIECLLRMTLQAKVGDTVAFVIEVTEAGVFELPGTFSQDDLTRFVRKSAPAILFPMARRDLAAFAVAAGFQPILLDHIDFDALVTEVVKRDWARLTPAPVSVDGNMLAAAHAARMQVTSPEASAPVLRVDAAPPVEVPVAKPAPAPAGEEADTPDTQPSWLDTQPVRVEQRPKRSSSFGWMAAVACAAVAAGAWWLWPRGVTKEPVAQVQQVQPASAQPAAKAAASGAGKAAPKPAEPPQATRKAIEDSRERLAALPGGWRSIELGRMNVDADLRALDALPLQAPVYLVRLPDGHLQVLYGAFPSLEAASATLEDTRGWKAQGLRGEPRIVVPGRS